MNLEELKANFNSWIKTLEIEIQGKEKSLNTLKAYSNVINQFIDFLEGKNIVEVTKASVMEYKKELVNLRDTEQLKTSTANSKITILNKFFKDIDRSDLKLSRLKSTVKTTQDNFINESDYNRLIRWADKLGLEREKLIMQTLAGTGIRINELQFFTVENLKKNKTSIVVRNKGKERSIIVPDKVRKSLLSYAKKNNIESGIIFCSSSDPNKLLDKAWIWRKLKFIAGKARVKKSKVKCHSFRHLYAQRYLKLYPDDITNLADLLGHSSLETTRLYTRLDEQEQKKRANKMFK